MFRTIIIDFDPATTCTRCYYYFTGGEAKAQEVKILVQGPTVSKPLRENSIPGILTTEGEFLIFLRKNFKVLFELYILIII